MISILINSLHAIMATLGFGIIFNIRGKNLIFSSIGGGISWFFYLLTKSLFSSIVLSMFIGAIVGSIYCEIMARVRKVPVTIFIICAIIPLVPGSGMYYAMYNSIIGNTSEFLNISISTISQALAIALGIIFVSSITKLITQIKKMKMKN